MALGRPKGGSNRYHSKEFKLEIVKRILNGEETDSVAAEFGLSGGMVRKWVMAFKVSRESALENRRKPGNPYSALHTSRSLTEVERLRLELAKAEVELAKLKKIYEMERSVAKQKN
ncbi:MAG TPA: helix-turn-helix domain-containing protein [Patescibacteria group bacterium]|nr:helix-turn-helix domain-containing protein [Patescibacteria group bacterium]